MYIECDSISQARLLYIYLHCHDHWYSRRNTTKCTYTAQALFEEVVHLSCCELCSRTLAAWSCRKATTIMYYKKTWSLCVRMHAQVCVCVNIGTVCNMSSKRVVCVILTVCYLVSADSIHVVSFCDIMEPSWNSLLNLRWKSAENKVLISLLHTCFVIF